MHLTQSFFPASLSAEAEKLIATDVIPDTPPIKPLVSTEVVAEAPPTKINTADLEVPSESSYSIRPSSKCRGNAQT